MKCEKCGLEYDERCINCPECKRRKFTALIIISGILILALVPLLLFSYATCIFGGLFLLLLFIIILIISFGLTEMPKQLPKGEISNLEKVFLVSFSSFVVLSFSTLLSMNEGYKFETNTCFTIIFIFLIIYLFIILAKNIPKYIRTYFSLIFGVCLLLISFLPYLTKTFFNEYKYYIIVFGFVSIIIGLNMKENEKLSKVLLFSFGIFLMFLSINNLILKKVDYNYFLISIFGVFLIILSIKIETEEKMRKFAVLSLIPISTTFFVFAFYFILIEKYFQSFLEFFSAIVLLYIFKNL